MDKIAQQLKAYIDTHPFDSGDSDCETVLDQLYQAYAESHESDPPEIRDSFKELDELLGALPLDDNNAVFNLCCRLCTAYERKAFVAGLQYGAHLISELHRKRDRWCKCISGRLCAIRLSRFGAKPLFCFKGDYSPLRRHLSQQ